MATTNKKIRDLNPLRDKGVGDTNYFLEFEGLLMNAIRIEGLDFNLERFVKYNLIENGYVGYDRMLDKWATCYGMGRNEIGNPTNLTFVTRNGRSWSRTATYNKDDNGAYRIMCLPTGYSLAKVIKKTTNFMELCDSSMIQNIKACRKPFIVVCKDHDMLLSYEQAIQEQQEGQAVLVVNDDLGDGLKGINIATEYIADKLIEIRDVERDKLLNKIGIMSANINKRERVQVGEVNATLGQCFDYIYLMIDTFNKQMVEYGLPYKMILNGTLEELYEENKDGAYSDDKPSDTSLEENKE